MAHHRLRLFCDSVGWSQGRLARELACSQAFVSYLLAGKKRPELRIALQIERVTSAWAEGPIAAEEWLAVVGDSEPVEAT
jgi:transcriptional regulator with XRE-family HTH domain